MRDTEYDKIRSATVYFREIMRGTGGRGIPAGAALVSIVQRS